MLIDDDQATNYLTKYALDYFNYSNTLSIYDLAQNALNDLEDRLVHQRDFPDIIFLDLHLPMVSGWDFLDYYEKFDHSTLNISPQIYILSTTINPKDLDKAESIKSVTKFYSKPLTQEIIKEIVTSPYTPKPYT